MRYKRMDTALRLLELLVSKGAAAAEETLLAAEERENA
jgi:hypothetical protein